MKPDEEAAYERGYAQAMRSVMADASRALGREVDAPQDAALLAEIHDARNALRDLCKEHGLSQEWSELQLHLADVVEKHVGRSLSRGEPGELKETLRLVWAETERVGPPDLAFRVRALMVMRHPEVHHD